MIGYLQGRLAENAEGRAIVTVGDDRGAVGYSLALPGSPTYALLPPGKTVSFYIYTHVREDVLDLFGFATKVEKDLFLALLSVSGIGPKGALGILSGGEPAEIFRAILSKDKDFLTRIPGIGKKTAERVVLELADTLRKKVDAGVLALPTSSLPASGATSRDPYGTVDSFRNDEPSAVRDAKAALLGLGFREQEITALLGRILAEETGLADEEAAAPHRAEDLVKRALRHLS